MALSNALFFVSVFVFPLLLRQSYGQDVTELSTLAANSSPATTLSPEPNTDLVSPSSNATGDDSTTTANTATPFATGGTTEGPLSFNTIISTTTDHITSAFESSSSSPPVNSSTDGSQQPSGSGWTQHFDLASFFGGIILAVGLLVLVLIVYKVCQLKRSGYSNLA